jgi:hypothetical protein
LGRSCAVHHETVMTQMAAAACKVPVLIPSPYYRPPGSPRLPPAARCSAGAAGASKGGGAD